MEKAAIELLRKYNEGKLTPLEMEQLEQYIEQGVIELEALKDLERVQTLYAQHAVPEPGRSMTEGFYQKLANEKVSKKLSFQTWWQSVWSMQPRFQWVYSAVILLVGLIGGYLLRPVSTGSTEIKKLSSEVTQMKEMMMLSLLEKESTSDRLRAVNLTSELPKVNKKITDALFKTLNTDDNVNVRLATIDALYPYAGHPDVRKGLIQSIDQQDSPLVQIALAEMMVKIQEKRSVKALEKLLDKENTPDEVREKIKESIQVLI